MSVINVTNSNYAEEVLESNVPVLIDFYAAWCMPCKMFASIAEEISESYAGKLKVVKINVDENMELAQKYGVMSIPTIKLVDAKEIKATNVGAMSKVELETWLLGHGVK